MRIVFRCRSVNCDAPVSADLSQPTGAPISCPECGENHVLRISEAVRSQDCIDRCVLCEGKELYVIKAFPQKIGLVIVVVAALASCVLLTRNTPAAFGVLAGAALLDLLIYWVAPRVTVCYRCGCRYLDFAPNPDHAGFDLATSDKYN